jgi:NAD-dependent DNA ligase
VARVRSRSIRSSSTGLVPASTHRATGDSRFAIDGEKLDRETSEAIARNAGMEVHARVTNKVRLLVDCDDRGVSGNQRKAIEYRIPVIREIDFWTALGLPVEPMT